MPEIIRSETVGGRIDLAGLCDVKGLKTAVEIGTDRGIFAAEFLSRWHGECFYCVDPWQKHPEFPWSRDGDFQLAVHLLAPHARRVRIIRATSSDVASYVGRVLGFPRSIDFVYIDAAHSYRFTLDAMREWWPLVSPNGILAGDDYGDLEHPGVRQAVHEFADEWQLPCHLTQDYNRLPSWYFEKAPNA